VSGSYDLCSILLSKLREGGRNIFLLLLLLLQTVMELTSDGAGVTVVHISMTYGSKTLQSKSRAAGRREFRGITYVIVVISAVPL